MSILSKLPPQVLLPLGTYDLNELETAASENAHRFLLADCGKATDKDTVLSAIAAGLSFDDHFGVNLDALYDCLTDLEPDKSASSPGLLVVLKNLPDSSAFDAAERNRVLDVFRDAAEFFNDEKVAFRVFYSVAGGQLGTHPSASC